MDWLIPVVTAAIAAIGGGITAWLSFRAKRVEVKETGWGTLSSAWERRLEELETDVADLKTEVGRLKGELREERHRSWITLTYLRQVLAWVCGWKPEDAILPPPPEELQQELSPFLRGK